MEAQNSEAERSAFVTGTAPTNYGNGIHGISVSETSRRWRGARRQLPFRVVCWDWRIKHIITSSSYRRVFSCRRLSSSHLHPSFPWVHRSWEHPFYRPTSCLRNPWLLEYCTYTGRAVVSRRRELKVLSTREFMAAINYNSQQSTLHLFGWIPALQKLSTRDSPTPTFTTTMNNWSDVAIITRMGYR